MFVKKVSFLSDGRIKFDWEVVTSGSDNPDEISRKFTECPRPEFDVAVENLKPYLVSICELQNDDIDKINIKEVSLYRTGENEVLGFVLKGSKNLLNSHVGLNLSTPLKLTEKANDNTEINQICSKKCAEDMQIFVNECIKFLNGIRLQVDNNIDS